MIPARFRRMSRTGNIRVLYGTIVAQARLAAFYAGYGVPDTVQGRFDLIVLHMVLVLHRLAPRSGPPASTGSDAGQELFDVFCRDLDDNLREMGVGDLRVPKEMRRFAEAFYGRQAAYRSALTAGDEQELEKALARNIFEVAGVDERAVRLARYARAAAEQLSATEEGALTAGKVIFPDPEAFAHGAA